MIIQCEQCRTKFRLDDEKVSDRGAKVRCAKCRHVFTVRKDEGQAEPATVAPLAAEAAAAPADEATRLAVPPAAEPEASGLATEPAVAFDFGTTPEPPAASFDLQPVPAPAASGFDFGDMAFTTDAAVAAPDLGDKTMVMPPKQTAEPVADLGIDFGLPPAPSAAVAQDEAAFDFGEALASGTTAAPANVSFDFGDQPKPAVAAGDVDLGGFDFGEALGSAAPAPAGGDFSFDDAVPQPQEAPAGSFDFSGVDFGQATPTGEASKPQVDAFSLGDMDFSTETAPVAVDAAAATLTGPLFAPVDEAAVQKQQDAAADISFEAPAAAPEEAPPLGITSRRRQSSTVSILIAVVTVLVVGVLGFMAYTFINDGPNALTIFGKGGTPVEDGKISVQNVKAYFVPKAAAGELLVITGEALNSYKKPRAALQVKGMVFGANSQPVATKTAFAGNTLTREQLQEMPVEKIEAAMNNQFGDSLANLEVQPGKTIPFTIVIVNPPKDGKDFGVEPLGSTVAASK